MVKLSKILTCILIILVTQQLILFDNDEKVFAQILKKWESKTNVSVNKTWFIQLSKKADPATITNDAIYITDSQNEKVPVKVSPSSQEDIIAVSPVSQYNYGQTYTLHITKGIKDFNGISLKEEVEMPFTVRQEPPGEPQVEYTEDVVFLKEDNADQQVIEHSQNYETFVMDSNAVIRSELKEGSIIILPPTTEAPFSLAKKITNLEVDGERVTVQTNVPKFEEVFETINIESEIPLTAKDFEAPLVEDNGEFIEEFIEGNKASLMAEDNWVFPKPSFSEKDNVITVKYENIVYKYKPSTDKTMTSTFNMSIEIDNPKYDYDFEFEDGKIKNVEMEMGVDNISYHIDAKVETAGAVAKKEFQIIKPKFRPIPGPYGVPLPIGGLVTLNGELQLEQQSEIPLYADFNVGYHINVKQNGLFDYKVDQQFNSNMDGGFEEGISTTSKLTLAAKPKLSFAYIENFELNKKSPVHYKDLGNAEMSLGAFADIKKVEDNACSDLKGHLFAEGDINDPTGKQAISLFKVEKEVVKFASWCDKKDYEKVSPSSAEILTDKAFDAFREARGDNGEAVTKQKIYESLSAVFTKTAIENALKTDWRYVNTDKNGNDMYMFLARDGGEQFYPYFNWEASSQDEWGASPPKITHYVKRGTEHLIVSQKWDASYLDSAKTRKIYFSRGFSEKNWKAYNFETIYHR